jgi:hypothetical protein
VAGIGEDNYTARRYGRSFASRVLELGFRSR